LLVDSMDRRCAFLEDVVGILELPRTRVVHSRAEDLGRSEVRGSVDGVMARSFGPPAVTAECAAPLLRLGGCLVVSEPPDATDRWPDAGLALLGLQLGRRLSAPAAIQTLVQVRDCPEEYPRRVGVPAKRPLF
jgi:16S rRNA (guanine527-N7)-methyltransferase